MKVISGNKLIIYILSCAFNKSMEQRRNMPREDASNGKEALK